MTSQPPTFCSLKQNGWMLIATLAFSSHLLLFRLVELWPRQLALLYTLLFALDVGLRHAYCPGNLFNAVLTTYADLTLYTVFVLISIGFFRLFFHRTAHYPGPKSWALSKWTLLTTDIHGLRPRVVHQAHLKYGDLVRTGPREISISSPHAIAVISSNNSACDKGSWYDVIPGGRGQKFVRSLFTIVDREQHQQRRKAWEAAFTSRALKGYEPAMMDNLDVLLSQLSKRAASGETVHIDDWMMLYSFDLISHVGFGRNLSLLEQGKLTPILELLEANVWFSQVAGHRPYVCELLALVPNPIEPFYQLVREQLAGRLQHGEQANPDIMEVLKEHARQRRDPSIHEDLHAKSGEEFAEAVNIMVAGSDTGASVMAMTLFLLVQHPKVVDELREELDEAFGKYNGSVVSDSSLLDSSCPLLNAVIDESMRLYPPVAPGLQKVNRRGPVTIRLHSGEIHVVPTDTIITVPTYTMHRDPRNFSPEPDAFRPERWMYPEKEDKMNREAFVPFSAGRHSCPGRRLARMEMRLVIANLTRKFDMVKADGFDADRFVDGVRDAFVSMRYHKLSVKLKERK
ncbi:benzoate 4-monooxygenase cytochrome P450 [Pseudozyma hubeiensis SY62]|uniref:Benzoate 4-monooxygenase cytochrome P450 n=1 Tax=Pseudozyma hubeiensis (strain SY62) TaxID=1305764 RepID=R9NYX0_PSEHS|nr:benzoate 4-monooxygenase cytochrome P450 [Pseudozyma hubeiensis SY62]GAC93901.1 benzoate 4-monooxygenase cytochrome P450 [Pseudozyma hubeiensis SY62]